MGGGPESQCPADFATRSFMRGGTLSVTEKKEKKKDWSWSILVVGWLPLVFVFVFIFIILFSFYFSSQIGVVCPSLGAVQCPT